MANWVTTTIKLEVGNEFAKSAFSDLVKKINDIAQTGIKAARHQEALVPVEFLFDDLKDKVTDRDTSTEILGAPDCNLMAWGNGSEILLESTYMYPEYAVLRIAQVVMDADPKSIVSAKIFEECPEFIGYEVFTDGECCDSEIISVEDLADDYDIDFEGDEDEDEDTDTYTERVS